MDMNGIQRMPKLLIKIHPHCNVICSRLAKTSKTTDTVLISVCICHFSCILNLLLE